MTDSSNSGLNRALDSIGQCKGQANFREWRRKIRHAIGFYGPSLLGILDGNPRPTPSGSNDAEITEWNHNNNLFYSLLFFATSGSATITVKAYEGTAAGSLGDGAAAWAALSERFDGNTLEARRALREQLYSSQFKPGGDPTEFFAQMGDLNLRLADMGEQASDEVYMAVVLKALTEVGELRFIRDIHYR